MVHLIGLNHRAQSRRLESVRTDAQDALEQVLRGTIQTSQPVLIAEEHSQEALDERQEVSIAKEIALREGIEHRFCDPTQNERRAIGYINGQSLERDIFMGDAAGISNDEIRLKARAIEMSVYFPIREQFWLERLAGFLGRSVVFVCGNAHIESFGTLLERNRVSHMVVRRGIGGTEEEHRQLERERHYLREHPEIVNEWLEEHPEIMNKWSAAISANS